VFGLEGADLEVKGNQRLQKALSNTSGLQPNWAAARG
jgi:hypothetical protein